MKKTVNRMKMIAALHVVAIARGRWTLPCPHGGGEGGAIVVVGVTGPLDGDACISSPMTEMAACMGSKSSFTLADDLPPHQGSRQCAQQSSQSGSLPQDPFCVFTTF
jgi:hypothetical protein